MDEEQKVIIKEFITRGFDKEDVEEILKEREIKEIEIKELLDFYDEEAGSSEKMKMGFFQKRKFKKIIKAMKDKLVKDKEIIEDLTKNIRKLNKDEKIILKNLKEQMIFAIIGNKENKQEGLIDIFDVSGEDGESITKDKLEKFKIEELEELLSELIEALEKEI